MRTIMEDQKVELEKQDSDLIKKFMENRSENALLDKMKACGMNDLDINVINRLPINKEARTNMVNKIILGIIANPTPLQPIDPVS